MGFKNVAGSWEFRIATAAVIRPHLDKTTGAEAYTYDCRFRRSATDQCLYKAQVGLKEDSQAFLAGVVVDVPGGPEGTLDKCLEVCQSSFRPTPNCHRIDLLPWASPQKCRLKHHTRKRSKNKTRFISAPS